MRSFTARSRTRYSRTTSEFGVVVNIRGILAVFSFALDLSVKKSVDIVTARRIEHCASVTPYFIIWPYVFRL